MNGGSIQVGYPDSPAVIEARTHMKGWWQCTQIRSLRASVRPIGARDRAAVMESPHQPIQLNPRPRQNGLPRSSGRSRRERRCKTNRRAAAAV